MPDRSESPKTSRTNAFRLLPLGDSAITVEFGNEIDPLINARVVAFAKTVGDQGWSGIVDIVPTYRSVTVHFDPHTCDSTELTTQLQALSPPEIRKGELHGTLHEIPVLYGSEWGPDLADVAALSGLQAAEAAALHASVRYRVYMLGFSPAFPYLGLVPERLAIPRLSTPRSKVPAGSIGIADRQTGIYPTSSPGGWRLIGRTPLSLYRQTSPNPFLLKAGDLVQFRPIELDEFNRLTQEAQHDNH